MWMFSWSIVLNSCLWKFKEQNMNKGINFDKQKYTYCEKIELDNATRLNS